MTAVQPLVSICIPTFNTESTIKEMVYSVVSQSYQNLEILVIDNCSTDNTVNIVEEIDDTRLTIYRNERNIGAEANFTRGVELAHGEFTCIFHSDDSYLPNIIEKQVRLFQTDSNIGAVFTRANLINDRGEIIGHSKLPEYFTTKNIFDFDEVFDGLLLYGNFFITPSCMIKSTVYKELVPFRFELFKTSSDLDMWLRLLYDYHIGIINENLMNYRLSVNSLSFRREYSRVEEADFYKTIDYHIKGKANIFKVPAKHRRFYEYKRTQDTLLRARNYLLQSDAKKSKVLLKQSISLSTFIETLKYIKHYKYLLMYLLSAFSLIAINLGIDKYPTKFMHWYFYRKK